MQPTKVCVGVLTREEESIRRLLPLVLGLAETRRLIHCADSCDLIAVQLGRVSGADLSVHELDRQSLAFQLCDTFWDGKIGFISRVRTSSFPLSTFSSFIRFVKNLWLTSTLPVRTLGQFCSAKARGYFLVA